MLLYLKRDILPFWGRKAEGLRPRHPLVLIPIWMKEHLLLGFEDI